MPHDVYDSILYHQDKKDLFSYTKYDNWIPVFSTILPYIQKIEWNNRVVGQAVIMIERVWHEGEQ